jgi:hypothetical protein
VASHGGQLAGFNAQLQHHSSQLHHIVPLVLSFLLVVAVRFLEVIAAVVVFDLHGRGVLLRFFEKVEQLPAEEGIAGVLLHDLLLRPREDGLLDALLPLGGAFGEDKSLAAAQLEGVE